MDDSALVWLPRFLSHLTVERRLSAHTDASYRGDLQRFVAYCDRNHVHDWRSLDSQHLRMFAAAEFRQGSEFPSSDRLMNVRFCHRIRLGSEVLRGTSRN